MVSSTELIASKAFDMGDVVLLYGDKENNSQGFKTYYIEYDGIDIHTYTYENKSNAIAYFYGYFAALMEAKAAYDSTI